MKLRYNCFLIVVACFHFPYFVRAKVSLPYTPPLHNIPSQPPKVVPNATANNLNALYPRKTDQKIAETEIALLRKKMHAKTMLQRSWISSMVVPGLGQIYNKDAWKVPCFYLGFFIAYSRVYSEHKAMNEQKRTLLLKNNFNRPTDLFTQKRIKECQRTRDLFIIITAAWYLLNIFDAYAGGHDQTVNLRNDIASIKPPTAIKPPTVFQPISPTLYSSIFL